MVIAIWLLALMLLLLWSAFAWMSHALLGMLSGAPWEQLLAQLKALRVHELIAPWWTPMVDALAPLLQASLPLLQGLLPFAGSALPVVVIVLWAIGSLILVLLAVAATVAAVMWRKKGASIKGKLTSL